jgi:hypothetical protein
MGTIVFKATNVSAKGLHRHMDYLLVTPFPQSGTVSAASLA